MEDNGEKNGLISLLSPFDYHIHTLWWLYVSSQKLPIQEYNLYSFFSVYQRLKLNNSSTCRFCHPTSSLLTQKQAVSVIQNNLHEGMSFIYLIFLEEKSLYYMEYSFLEIFGWESWQSISCIIWCYTCTHRWKKNCPPPTEHIALDFHMIEFV